MSLLRELVLPTLESGLPITLVFFGIYIVFKLLNDFDLTVEGSFTLGAAVTAKMILDGQPYWLAMLAAVAAGMTAGLVTATVHTTLRVSLLLSGIISMTALFTVNLRIMGQPNLSLLGAHTIFSRFDNLALTPRTAAIVGVMAVFVGVVLLALVYFLNTEYGLALRATGMNREMARSVGVNTHLVMFVALLVSNGLAALGGSIAAQDQGYSDAQMGVGLIVAGVASILVGGLLIPRVNRVVAGVASVVVGAIVYRFVLVYALRVGLQPYDLQGFTAGILIAAIAISRFRKPLARIVRSGLGRLRGTANDSRSDAAVIATPARDAGPSVGARSLGNGESSNAVERPRNA